MLACPKCNIKKSNKLPSRQLLAGIVMRNQKVNEQANPTIFSEFKGYHDDLLWQIWDYASRQGYEVFEHC